MKSDLQIKEHLFAQCGHFVEERLKKIQNRIQEIQVSLTSETKSSAGDKHETGRAMLQLEREKVGQQLVEVEQLKIALSKINPTKSSDNSGLGSVVITSKFNYFIAISAGEFKVMSQSFFAISPHTPMGSLLMGKKIGEVVVFRDSTFVIENIY